MSQFSPPSCPDCGSPMKLRVAKKGPHPGSQFFGCTKYPSCRGTVNYDPLVHGQPDVAAWPAAGRARSPSYSDLPAEVKLPELDAKVPFELPIPMQLAPRKRKMAAVAMQTVGYPEEFVDFMGRTPGARPADLRRAMSQWRLDMPASQPAAKGKSTEAVLSVLDKIMTRGAVTLASPKVRLFLEEQVGDLQGITEEEWGRAALKIARTVLVPGLYEVFDSKEEQHFYKDLLPQMAPDADVLAWTTAQVPIAFLTAGAVEAKSDQRVDFLISHPDGARIVVEIDGQQHTETAASDMQRDEQLRALGFEVFRIKAGEIRAGGGAALAELGDRLQRQIPVAEPTGPFPVAEAVLACCRAASQIQLSICSALYSGFLVMKPGQTWNIHAASPSWCRDEAIWKMLVKAAMADLEGLLNALFQLYHDRDLKLRISVAAAETAADLVLSLGQASRLPSSGTRLEIADLFLPHSLQPLGPPARDPKSIHPNQAVLKYLLKYVFGHDDFKDGQWEPIERILRGLDTILLLPTAAGKSMVYELASMVMPGMCLVVQPLVALIEDQRDNLRRCGIDRVAAITSVLTREEKQGTLMALQNNAYWFCYVAPERLQMEDFRRSLQLATISAPICLIAIDEAHCVSEWGHDFRTSYLNVARNTRTYCGHNKRVPPLLGLTGTASYSVLKDVQRELAIPDESAVLKPASFDRQELEYRVLSCTTGEKAAVLRRHLETLPHHLEAPAETFFEPHGRDTNLGLIFYPNVDGDMGAFRGYEMLQLEDYQVGLFTGRAPKSLATSRWEDAKMAWARDFKHNKISMLACTNAFGMGVDIRNIRYTVHMGLPRSLEAFYQEAGRAGRDGKQSVCCMIVSDDHAERNEQLLHPSTPLSSVQTTIGAVNWDDQDDVSRMLYFHVNAFRGPQEEIQEVRELMQSIGNIRVQQTISVDCPAATRIRREKAVHRLTILGVLADYTMDYAHGRISVQTSGIDQAGMLGCFLQYIDGYDPTLVDSTEARLHNFASGDYASCVEGLLNELELFIYERIELSRRRALWEMLVAAKSGDLRGRLNSYLHDGPFAELLAEAREDTSGMAETIARVSQQMTTAAAAEEMRGQSARFLESYPDSPGLLLIRALSELLSKHPDEKIAFANLDAAFRYGYERQIGLSSLAEAVSRVADLAERRTPGLGPKIVDAFLRSAPDPRAAARALVSGGSRQFAYVPAEYLIRSICDRLDGQILQGVQT